MKGSPSHVRWRAISDTATLLTAAVGLALAWMAEDVPDGARRLATLAACVLFLLFFGSAAHSWKRLRAERPSSSPRA